MAEAVTGSARVIVEVAAGVIPEHPELDYTRQWVLTSEDWHAADADGKGALLAELNGRAQGYAALLMLQPDRFNWVRTDWLYL